MRPLNEGAGDDSAVLQHILQIHQVAVVHVLGIVVGVVEVDDALLVGLHNVRGKQQPLTEVPGDLAGHVVPLGGVHHWVLVGVLLLGLLVAALDEAEDLFIGGVAAANQGAGIAVGDIVLGHLVGAVGHDLIFHQILNFFHRGRAVHLQAAELHEFCDAPDLHGRHAGALFHAVVGLGNGSNDFFNVENNFCSVAFDDFHARSLRIISAASRAIYLILLHYNVQDIVCTVTFATNLKIRGFLPKAAHEIVFCQKMRKMSIGILHRNYGILSPAFSGGLSSFLSGGDRVKYARNTARNRDSFSAGRHLHVLEQSQ